MPDDEGHEAVTQRVRGTDVLVNARQDSPNTEECSGRATPFTSVFTRARSPVVDRRGHMHLSYFVTLNGEFAIIPITVP
jgi:hypothetical protein